MGAFGCATHVGAFMLASSSLQRMWGHSCWGGKACNAREPTSIRAETKTHESARRNMQHFGLRFELPEQMHNADQCKQMRNACT